MANGELTKEEFFQAVVLVLDPGITEERYDEMWDGFVAFKKRRKIHLVDKGEVEL